MVPFAVFAVALLAYLPWLDTQYVWTKDEARPGLVAKEMVTDGQWAIPRFGGRLYVEKPPLFPWLVALASPRGVSEWTLRLPSAIAAAITVTVTYLLGARMAGPAAGGVAAGVLASSFAFFGWARTGRGEMVLVLWITLGFWSLVRWFEEGRGRDAAGLGFWMGLGLLTKGPIALIPAAGALALVLAERPNRPRLRHAALAGVIAAGLPLLWLLAAAVSSRDAAEYVLGIGPQFVTELYQPAPRHPAFPLGAVAAGFLPWTLLTPSVAWLAVRHWRAGRRLLVVTLGWVGIIALTFTLLVRPREAHFLPIYPALALLVGWAWHVASPATRRLVMIMLSVLAALMAMIGVVLWLSGTANGRTFRDLPLQTPGLPAVTLVALGAALLTWLLARRGQVGQAGLAFAGAMLLFVLVLERGVYTPTVNAMFPTPAVAARFAARLPGDVRPVFVDRKLISSLVFYLPQRAQEVPTLDAFLALRPSSPIYLLLVEPDFSNLKLRLGGETTVLERLEINRTVYVLARLDEFGSERRHP